MVSIHLGYFLVSLVVKTVLQRKQEFEGMALNVKPYDESMEKDNCDYEVFHNWYNDFYNFLSYIKECYLRLVLA